MCALSAMDQVSARRKLASLAEFANTAGSHEEAWSDFDALAQLVKDADGPNEVSLIASLLFNGENGIFMALRASVIAHGSS